MHQITMALFVLLWLMTDIHVANMLQKTGLENKLQLALAVSDVKLIADLVEE